MNAVLVGNPLLTAQVHLVTDRRDVSEFLYYRGEHWRNRDNTMRIDSARWALPRNEVALLDLGKPPPA